MNRMAQPIIAARNTSKGNGRLRCAARSESRKLAETTKVNRSRGHANMRLKPLGTDAAVVAMVRL